MSYIVVDVETDGPILGIHSMICFGAIVLDEKLDKTFYGQTKPVSVLYDTEALVISGFSREQHENFEEPKEVFIKFKKWLSDNSIKSPILISDNNQFDGSWINWYFHIYLDENPFGWSSRRIGDLFSGFYNNPYYKWKKHRKTKHTHHPVDDAKGNAEALLYLKSQGFKL